MQADGLRFPPVYIVCRQGLKKMGGGAKVLSARKVTNTFCKRQEHSRWVTPTARQNGRISCPATPHAIVVTRQQRHHVRTASALLKMWRLANGFCCCSCCRLFACLARDKKPSGQPNPFAGFLRSPWLQFHRPRPGPSCRQVGGVAPALRATRKAVSRICRSIREALRGSHGFGASLDCR